MDGKKEEDDMAGPWSDDEKKALKDTILQLINGIPQPDEAMRLAAFIRSATTVADLGKERTTELLALEAAILNDVVHAKIEIHNRDGSIESYCTPDFHWDIRPGSPYYSDE